MARERDEMPRRYHDEIRGIRLEVSLIEVDIQRTLSCRDTLHHLPFQYLVLSLPSIYTHELASVFWLRSLATKMRIVTYAAVARVSHDAHLCCQTS